MRLPGLLRFKSNECFAARPKRKTLPAPGSEDRFALRSNPVSIFEQVAPFYCLAIKA
jgi:hypothetical protein